MIKQDIISQITESLKRGENTEDVFVQYIYQCIFLERNPQATIMPKDPTPLSVWDKLKDNDVISKEDICLKFIDIVDDIYYMQLIVNIHPSLTLTIENYDGLTITLNGCSKVKNWVRYLSAEETAQWIIRIKQNMPQYTEEWNEMLDGVLKTLKGQRLAMSAINAIFVNAMKEYPKVRYTIKQQKVRARIDVILPNETCKIIYAYWNSYMKSLPGKLDKLKVIIDKSAKLDAECKM